MFSWRLYAKRTVFRREGWTRVPARFRGSRTPGRRGFRGYFGADVSMQPPGGPPSRDTPCDRPNQTRPRKRRCTKVDAATREREREGEKEREKVEGAWEYRSATGLAAETRKTNEKLKRREGERRRTLSGERDTIAGKEIYSSGRNCFRGAHVRRTKVGTPPALMRSNFRKTAPTGLSPSCVNENQLPLNESEIEPADDYLSLSRFSFFKQAQTSVELGWRKILTSRKLEFDRNFYRTRYSYLYLINWKIGQRYELFLWEIQH